MSRYYDPKIGRFISPDTPDYLAPDTIGGVDLYAYCNYNPVMGYDPTGHWDWGRFWIGVGIVAVAAAVVAITVATAGATSGLGAAIIGGTISAAGDLFSQTVIEGKTLEEVNYTSVGISLISGVVGSSLGLFGSSVVSGLAEGVNS